MAVNRNTPQSPHADFARRVTAALDRLERAEQAAEQARRKVLNRFGLRQHLDRVLAPLQVRLLPPDDRFWVDTSDLLRGDAEAIQKLLMALQGDAQRAPIASREELRHVAGLPRDVDGEFAPPVQAPPPPSGGGPAPRDEGGTAMTASAFKAARHALGMTIEALAERLGVEPRSVRRWQSGEREIPGPVVTALGLLLRART